MSLNSERILSLRGMVAATPRALYSSTTTRWMETQTPPALPHESLMQKAGLALARLALAVAPHAQTFWIACGPGNNGGDGFAAACFLQQWGKTPRITYLENPAQPPDALAARQAALLQGVDIGSSVPEQFDACIDCLFGIGTLRAFNAIHSQWIATMNGASVPVIAADVPSGLNADTGATTGLHVKANYTLCLLTLKPGLFTGDGREACGDIWFNNLDTACPAAPVAELLNPLAPSARAHNTHKGTFGDVAVIGGAAGMTGAAVLAASAALYGGAGRIFVGLLHDEAPAWDSSHPELMFRAPSTLRFEKMAVVAGCGGADAIAAYLEKIIQQSAQLVLDADALNHLADKPAMRELVRQRSAHTTVLTPHPLEAARLMACSTADIQSDRLQAAQTLAENFNATVVLKGSGSVVATPGRPPRINISGNGLLATGGTGDVLAGLIGALLAHGHHAEAAACEAVYRHGTVANRWDHSVAGALTASRLSASI